MSDIIIKALDQSTIDRQIALFDKVFSTQTNRAMWLHKHYNNPYIDCANIFGAFYAERLVGLNAFMPGRYIYNGRIYKAAQSCESAIDPDFRRRGIFSQIIMYAEDEYIKSGYDFLVGYPNQNSYPAFLKMNWTHPLDQEIYVNRLSLRGLTRKYLKVNIPVLEKIMSHLLHNQYGKFYDASFEVVGGKSPGFPSYLDQPSGDGVVATMVDDDFLKWKLRFLDVEYFNIKQNNRIVAQFLVYTRDYRSMILYYRFLGGHNCICSSISALCRFLSSNSRSLHTWIPNNDVFAGAMLECGFKKTSGKTHFIFKQLSNQHPEFGEAKRWELYPIETDTVIQLETS